MTFDQIPSKKINRVIWAVDPFKPNSDLDADTLKDFDKWLSQNEILVDPVYVFTPIGEIEKLAAEKIAAKIGEMVSRWGVRTNPPYVLIRPIESAQSVTSVLLNYAESAGADLIVVSSHGRKGFQRMIFGSFAESLLNTSPLPLLFLNKNPRPAEASFENVLWATDFSKACETAFEVFLLQTSQACKQISLFHDVSLPMEIGSYFAQWEFGIPSPEDILERQLRWARQQASTWMDKAKREGFTVGQMAVDSSRGEVVNNILSAAQNAKAGMIVMASQTGPVGSMLLGSHARDVFRSSEFPVWIYGPQFCDITKRMQTKVSIAAKLSSQLNGHPAVT